MKTLFIVDTLGAGGAERSLQELLPRFRAGGVDPIVACFHTRREGVEQLVLREHDVRILRGRNRLAQMRALRALAKAERVELAHTTLFEADVFGRSALGGSGIPVVTSLVNMPYERARLANDPNVDRKRLAVARGLEIVTGQLFARHFHAITEAVKQSAVERLWIPPSRITVVHRGRDATRLGRRSPERRARARHELGIADDVFVVLNVARQEFQKGQRHLIAAFEQLRRVRPAAELLIAGRSGNASRALLEVADASGAGVRFLGHRDDVPELMVAADVFALPSLWEGLGGVLIEAMALELPIISSDLPPTREVLADGKRGLLVAPGDEAATARALLRLAADQALSRSLSDEGRRAFELHFTLEASAERLLALFERALSGH
ncbi:MAG TPA: glycosyltransferase family 4 protein [Polyangiaceae bacterium]|nr:glycosyltransferase family 4 protein [Polyangiaceae bacterium]